MLILFLILSERLIDVESSTISQQGKPSTETMEKQETHRQGIGNSVLNLLSSDQQIHHGLDYVLKSSN